MNQQPRSNSAYNHVINVGVKKTKNYWIATLCSAILAGMFIALSGFAAATASFSIENYSVAKLVSGMIFPVGLILVVICGTELFTGNNLLTVALFEKEIKLNSLMKNWILVYFGNIIGTALIAVLIYYSGLLESNHGLLGGYAVKVAANKTSLDITTAFIRGILCNVLVCMAVWGSYNTERISGKVLMLHLPTMAFIISGFEHSVANMYYLVLGMLAKGNELYIEASHLPLEVIDNINISNILGNILIVTLGNIVGGALIISGLFFFINKNHSKTIKVLNEIKQ